MSRRLFSFDTVAKSDVKVSDLAHSITVCLVTTKDLTHGNVFVMDEDSLPLVTASLAEMRRLAPATSPLWVDHVARAWRPHVREFMAASSPGRIGRAVARRRAGRFSPHLRLAGGMCRFNRGEARCVPAKASRTVLLCACIRTYVTADEVGGTTKRMPSRRNARRFSVLRHPHHIRHEIRTIFHTRSQSNLGRSPLPYTFRAPLSPTAFGRWKIQFCQAVSRPNTRV